MDRRTFMAWLGAVPAMCSTLANAQQRGQMPTVGVLMGIANDEESHERAKLIEQGLARRGWVVGQNLRIEYKFPGSKAENILELAKELVALQPDVIIAHSTPVVAALHQITQTIPIVFVVVGDPVGSGFVASMARPGGNITGFTVVQPTIAGKYLSILKELNPKLTHVAVMYNAPSVPAGAAIYIPTFVKSAKEFQVTPIVNEVHSPDEISAAMSNLAGIPGSALIVLPGNFTTLHRGSIISLAASLRIPALYPYRYFVEEGGLLSYGVDVLDLFRRAPDYVDRILRGEKPSNLPVQAPRKFELVINLKTASMLGLVVPRILLAGADALID